MTQQAVAMIRRIHVIDVPVTVRGDTPSEILAEARRAANVLKDSLEGDSAGVETRVLSVEGADGAQIHKAPAGMFEVVWKMTVPATEGMSAEDAACIARVVQADPASPMSVFMVRDERGNESAINLAMSGTHLH